MISFMMNNNNNEEELEKKDIEIVKDIIDKTLLKDKSNDVISGKHESESS